ncbi:hypothetical protein ACLOJK_036042 [Asimina triloba]
MLRSLAFCLLISLSIHPRSAISGWKIGSLPGFPGPLPFSMETGYIAVGESKEDHLFYYFIESERYPKEDPLLLWITGGPGCSAWSGLVFEIDRCPKLYCFAGGAMIGEKTVAGVQEFGVWGAVLAIPPPHNPSYTPIYGSDSRNCTWVGPGVQLRSDRSCSDSTHRIYFFKIRSFLLGYVAIPRQRRSPSLVSCNVTQLSWIRLHGSYVVMLLGSIPKAMAINCHLRLRSPVSDIRIDYNRAYIWITATTSWHELTAKHFQRVFRGCYPAGIKGRLSPTSEPSTKHKKISKAARRIKSTADASLHLIMDYNGSVPALGRRQESWTKVASIIFLDSPVWTGFSYSSAAKAEQNGDIRSSKEVREFLLKWYSDHPHFLSNPLYIGGDSYSGITVPVIAQEIANAKFSGLKADNEAEVLHPYYSQTTICVVCLAANEAGSQPVLNLKGYLVGNPGTDYRFDGNYRVPYLHGMAIISDELYQAAKESCKGDYLNPSNPQCAEALDGVNKVGKNQNGPNLYEEINN